jgi:hypothetical protein
LEIQDHFLRVVAETGRLPSLFLLFGKYLGIILQLFGKYLGVIDEIFINY